MRESEEREGFELGKKCWIFQRGGEEWEGDEGG